MPDHGQPDLIARAQPVARDAVALLSSEAVITGPAWLVVAAGTGGGGDPEQPASRPRQKHRAHQPVRPAKRPSFKPPLGGSTPTRQAIGRSVAEPSRRAPNTL